MMKEKQSFNSELDCSAQYAALDNNKKKVLRDRFLEETGVSYPGFYAKLRRRCWGKLEVQVFNRIIKEVEQWN